MSGKKSTAGAVVDWFDIPNLVPEPGWYLITFQIQFSDFVTNVSKTIPNYEVLLWDYQKQLIMSYKGFVDLSGWLRISMANVWKFNENACGFKIQTYSPYTCTVNNGLMRIRGFKLFDAD